MKDFLTGALLIVGMLALILGVRVARFVQLPGDIAAVNFPAPIAAVDTGCGVMAIKMPCFRSENPEGPAVASVARLSGSTGAKATASQDIRCASQPVKFPCLQHPDPRS
jgi:hypothetical protein